MTTSSNKSKPKESSSIRMVPLKCKNCGDPINPELTKCEYCDVSFYLNNNEDKLSSAKRKEETREDINKAVRNVKDGMLSEMKRGGRDDT